MGQSVPNSRLSQRSTAVSQVLSRETQPDCFRRYASSSTRPSSSPERSADTLGFFPITAAADSRKGLPKWHITNCVSGWSAAASSRARGWQYFKWAPGKAVRPIWTATGFPYRAARA